LSSSSSSCSSLIALNSAVVKFVVAAVTFVALFVAAAARFADRSLLRVPEPGVCDDGAGTTSRSDGSRTVGAAPLVA